MGSGCVGALTSLYPLIPSQSPNNFQFVSTSSIQLYLSRRRYQDKQEGELPLHHEEGSLLFQWRRRILSPTQSTRSIVGICAFIREVVPQRMVRTVLMSVTFRVLPLRRFIPSATEPALRNSSAALPSVWTRCPVD